MCTHVCSLSGAVYIGQAKSCNLISSFLSAPANPCHTHTHASTSQHRELLEETLCYLTKTCWRQCVWVRRAVGIGDTLLPCVHPECSHSGCGRLHFHQNFLPGNPEINHSCTSCKLFLHLLILTPERSFLSQSWTWVSGTLLSWFHTNFLLKNKITSLPSSLTPVYLPAFFPPHLQPQCSPPLGHVSSICACWQPGRCAQVFPSSLSITQTHHRSPLTHMNPYTTTHSSIFPFRNCHVCPDELICI